MELAIVIGGVCFFAGGLAFQLAHYAYDLWCQQSEPSVDENHLLTIPPPASSGSDHPSTSSYDGPVISIPVPNIDLQAAYARERADETRV